MIKVAAAIIRNSDQVLIARRYAKDALHGCWEFPGGKIETDETPETCLQRELFEELNISIEIEGFYTDSIYEYPDKKVHLLAYLAKLVGGVIELRVHDKIEWVSLTDLNSYVFAPADIPIVQKLIPTSEIN